MRLFIILLLALSTVPAIATRPLDWRFEAQICGNYQVDEDGILRARIAVWKQGCRDIQVVPVTDGSYLVYGTKVVRTVEY